MQTERMVVLKESAKTMSTTKTVADTTKPAIDLVTGKSSCSLWLENLPLYRGQKVAFLGNYNADPDADAWAVEMLHEAAGIAEKESDARYLIGPINGNTWNPYRLVTEGFDQPAFALETYTDKCYPGQFEAAGFVSVAEYASSILPCKEDFCGRYESLAKELADRGITVRNFDRSKVNEELDALYKVSIEAFADNFLYSPITKDQFLSLYKPIIDIVDEELVLIAEKDGIAVGYLFAIANKLLAPTNNVFNDSLVLKTLARVPGTKEELGGIGLYLTSLCHARAKAKGFERIIHALYKNDNRSACFSNSPDIEVFRKYNLFAKELNHGTSN